jgi:ABC-type protease/lipase transport system fused ATPase/permease subunit
LKAGGATVIVITHRPSVLFAVDRIVGLRDGAVEMDGSRAEILARIFPQPGRGPQTPDPSSAEPLKRVGMRQPAEQS